MKNGSWLALAVGGALVAGSLPARAGEVQVCAFDNDKDIKVVLTGEASAGIGLDEELKYNNKPALSLMGNWGRAWDSVIFEFKPLELPRAPVAVSLTFRGDTNLDGLIHFTIQDSKGETLRAVLSKTMNNEGWKELRTAVPWQEATWDGGATGNRQLDPPCTLTSLMFFARRPVKATVYFAELKVILPDPPKPAK